MNGVSRILRDFQNELATNADQIQLGEMESKLLDNLRNVVDRNRKVFYLVIVLLVISYILAGTFIWYWRDNTAVLVAVFGATGITVPWAINSIVGLWKDISNAETLHVLISHLDDKRTTK